LYEKVDTNLNFAAREKAVADFWRENHIAQQAVDQREGCETFTFYDGPPTANGRPHIGHVLTRVIKDMLPRYQSMKGCKVLRKAGWDTHGLPVELEVEKAIGINGKEQIEDYGIEPFIKKCRESVWKYKAMWEEFSDVVGFWADMEHPYITYENNFIESEWWALKEIWKKGLLYQGHKIVPYCPRCGTPLSSHEVAQGYKDVKERSAMVKFKAKGEDAYFLAWTTTPWTLPSNTALCVGPTIEYVAVRTFNPYSGDPITVVLALPLLHTLFALLVHIIGAARTLVSQLPTGRRIMPQPLSLTSAMLMANPNPCGEQRLTARPSSNCFMHKSCIACCCRVFQRLVLPI